MRLGKACNNKFHTLFFSLNIIREMKEDDISWVCSMHRKDSKCVQNSSHKTFDFLKDLGIYRRIILKLILEKLGGRSGLDSSGSGYRQVVGSCKHGTEPSGSIKGKQFLEQLSNY
jgi:hypothetical protein